MKRITPVYSEESSLSIYMLTVVQYDKHSTRGYCLPPFRCFGETKTPTHTHTHTEYEPFWRDTLILLGCLVELIPHTLQGCPVLSTCFFHDFLPGVIPLESHDRVRGGQRMECQAQH